MAFTTRIISPFILFWDFLVIYGVTFSKTLFFRLLLCRSLFQIEEFFSQRLKETPKLEAFGVGMSHTRTEACQSSRSEAASTLRGSSGAVLLAAKLLVATATSSAASVSANGYLRQNVVALTSWTQSTEINVLEGHWRNQKKEPYRFRMIFY